MVNIGARIKQRRVELGLSVEDVAARLGKNRATVYRYESNDIKDLPTAILEPLAKVLETTPADLMGWETTVPRNNARVYNAQEIVLLGEFHKLNKEGRFEAIKRVRELKLVPEYRKSIALDDIDISIDFKDKSQTIAASGLDENTPVTDHNEEVMQKALNRIKKKKEEEEDRKELEMPL